ncbi:MAG: deoxyribose-phosphate aldolase [Actinomycetia bacterium]|nr:deoxyribose-phosphate aldolase [Actinomycetes bacterium]
MGTPLNRLIDHTLLAPTATTADVARLCEEARSYDFFAVCVNSAWVTTAVAALAGTTTRVAAVVGFPLGAQLPAAKAAEAKLALQAGATEIDMVIALGPLLTGDDAYVHYDIATVVAAAKAARTTAVVKVILETAALTDEQIVHACELAREGGADFVKTSTGFLDPKLALPGRPTGATTEAVSLMRRTLGDTLGVKASGGISTREQAEALVAAGATRLGTSRSLALVEGYLFQDIL